MRRKLLLADDSPTIQRVIELTFAEEDFDVVCVSDGQQAIERISSERPDVVLADVEMPEQSGYDVSAFVKDRPDLAHIPVILLTGAFEPIDEQRADAARADAVLAKPFEPQAVVEQVRALVANHVVPAGVALGGADPELPLEGAGASASVHSDPGEALAKAETPPDQSESVDEYLDRLDAAFATLGASTANRGASALATGSDTKETPAAETGSSSSMARAVEPDADSPAIVDSAFEAPAVEERVAPGLLDAPARDGGIPLTSVEPGTEGRWSFGDSPAPEPAVEAAVPLTPLEDPAPEPSHLLTPPALEVTTFGDAGGAEEPVAEAEPAPLADAFAALLAAEQGEPTTEVQPPPAQGHVSDVDDATVDRIAERVLGKLGDRLPGAGASGVAEPAISDEFVDRITRSVVEKMGDQAVRETVADVVLTVADRLVREEIERLKSEAP